MLLCVEGSNWVLVCCLEFSLCCVEECVASLSIFVLFFLSCFIFVTETSELLCVVLCGGVALAFIVLC